MRAGATFPRVATALVAVAAAIVLAGCGGGERQDADEPEGEFRVEVVEASFPSSQRIADRATMSIRVRNPGTKTVRDVAVTVQTRPRERGAGAVAFAQSENDPRLSDPDRPIWILDREPRGATTAYTNTWALGPLRGGQSRTFEWQVTPVQPGRYTIEYQVSPGLDGRARLADGSRARGSFRVTVADEPVPARVNDAGEVVRGEEAGAGAD